MHAAERRQEREEQKRLRDLERQAKEEAKLSAIEQARLQVERFESRLSVLLSVYKECGEPWDWPAVASSLPPPSPRRHSFHEQKAMQALCVASPQQRKSSQSLIDQARLNDDQDYQVEEKAYSQEIAQWEKLRQIARRVLAGEHKAYTEALVECNPFGEMSELGSSIHFIVHNRNLAECVLKVAGRQAIPAELETLTSTGKVSVKPMPKGRFHEIYQDYLSGCVLRVAREIFALLPLGALIITAAADSVDPSTGQTVEQTVLSVFIPRVEVARLNFDRLDPADAIENFQHRGDFKASRKSEAFQPIAPLTPADIEWTSIEELGLHDLLAKVQRVHEELKSEGAKLNQRADTALAQPNSML
jgi:hypothetical protein